ncbi:hypothetical protein [Kitasatospora purpeofusca]|uniref:Uncharacterized protein n=1 Tax=Kitasatospora purpeofusca TaxID=67352 RepID=A0ABZ1UBB4_9ACTN|nr:hypothetical protein [Kitasatospora purpeofusca]
MEVRGTDIDILRDALAAAETDTLPGIDAPALRSALSAATPVPGSRRHTMTPSGTELAAVLSVLYLESLVRDSAGYHHLLRQLPGDLARRAVQDGSSSDGTTVAGPRAARGRTYPANTRQGRIECGASGSGT